MPEKRRETEVIRLLERYLIEVVERWNMCPWAKSARKNGEVAIGVVWGTPTVAEWAAAARALLDQPTTRVAIVVAPEYDIDRIDLHTVRNDVSGAVGATGVAEFHPDAPLDLASPSRLVPFVRRSPDPMLQLVPLTLLDALRANSDSVTRVQQIGMLADLVPPSRPDPADMVAENNFETVSAAHADIVATLADIAADRARTYAALGLAATPLTAGTYRSP